MAVEITWLGRTSFRLRGREGTVITDPVPASSGFKIGKASAGVATLSRVDDPEFGDPSLVPGARVLDAPGEYEVGGVLVTGVPLPLPEGGRNMAYLCEIESLRICHLGVMPPGDRPTLPDELDDIDVLLLPVGNGPGLTARQAVDLMTKVDPGIVIPMLYKAGQETMELDTLDPFLSETGSKHEPQTRCSVTKASLPDAMTVTVLQPRSL